MLTCIQSAFTEDDGSHSVIRILGGRELVEAFRRSPHDPVIFTTMKDTDGDAVREAIEFLNTPITEEPRFALQECYRHLSNVLGVDVPAYRICAECGADLTDESGKLCTGCELEAVMPPSDEVPF